MRTEALVVAMGLTTMVAGDEYLTTPKSRTRLGAEMSIRLCLAFNDIH